MTSLPLPSASTWQALLRGRRLSVPFVNAPALSDVKWLFALTPVWWFLGVEQFIWFPLLFITFARVMLASRFRIRVTQTAAWLGMFVLVQAMAAFFVVEPYRLLTVVRTIALYASAWMLLVILTHCATQWRDVRTLVRVVILVMTFSAIVGLIGLSGVWRGSFVSPMGMVLPDVVRSSSFGGRIALKEIGREGYFIGFGAFYRLTSLFNFSTMYASALALTIPAAFYIRKTARSRVMRIILGGLIVALLVNFVFTTGRGAMLACFLGGAIMVLMGAAVRARVRLVVVSAIAGAVLIVGAMVVRPQDTVVPIFETLLYARGGGSISGRATVYRLSAEVIKDRPLFGWGSQRHHPDSVYPLGSHSYHLGVLYKFGAVGLAVFAAMWFALWRESRPGWRTSRKDRNRWEADEFLRYGRWIFAAAVLNGVTEVLDLDAITFMLMWLLFSLLVATRVNVLAERDHDR